MSIITFEKWEEKTLGEVCLVERGSSPRPIKNFITDDGSGVNWIKIGDCSGKYVTSTAQKITEEGAKKSRYVKKGDFVISNSMSYGKPYILKIDGYIHDGWFVLRLNKNLVNADYFYYLLSSNYIKEQYDALATGAIVQNISSDLIKRVQFNLPPLSEQERIVAKLDKAFEAIDKVKANAEQNLNNAKELFNDAQTTIFNEPFEEKNLGDICTLYQGLAINMKTKHLLCDKSTLPLLRIKDLKENCETQYVVEEGFPKNALVNESDIIYTRTGSLGLVFRGRKGVLHNNSFKVVPQKNISNDYLFEWLQNPIFNKKIVSLAQRAAQPDITHTLFKQQIINVPPFEIQLKKVKQINVIREYINTLNQIYTKKIKKCDELKQSILQKAFRGEL